MQLQIQCRQQQRKIQKPVSEGRTVESKRFPPEMEKPGVECQFPASAGPENLVATARPPELRAASGAVLHLSRPSTPSIPVTGSGLSGRAGPGTQPGCRFHQFPPEPHPFPCASSHQALHAQLGVPGLLLGGPRSSAVLTGPQAPMPTRRGPFLLHTLHHPGAEDGPATSPLTLHVNTRCSRQSSGESCHVPVCMWQNRMLLSAGTRSLASR